MRKVDFRYYLGWFKLISLFLLALLVILSIIGFISYKFLWTEEYIDKDVIQRNMSKVISNGGSIDEVKHLYESTKTEKMPVIGNYAEFRESHYKSDVSLSYILADLLVKYYQNDSLISDSVYIDQLRCIVTDYNIVHPFDALDESQRYYLENIRQKLDSDYNIIQEDLVKLGDDLDRKNVLVNTYLNKSETSFWISIFAVVITILLSAWQIYQGHRSNKQMDQFLECNKKNSKQ